MVIEVRFETKYGVEHCYIVNPEIECHVRALTGCKTLTTNHIVALKKLGFTFKQVQEAREI